MHADRHTSSPPRRGAALCAWLVATSLVLVGLAAAPASAAGEQVQIVGHGWGHGRGMGQWGAYGYALDHGWSSQQILDHFYGGTVGASDAGNPEVSVALLSQAGRDLIATGPSLSVGGAAVGAAAVRVSRVGGALQVSTGPSCAGPWQPWGTPTSAPVTVAAVGAGYPGMLQQCVSGGQRGYRGRLTTLLADGTQQTVNLTSLDDYLRGVVPREMPASWADAGGGRGAQALAAQAVAARSYALASRYSSWAQTCDTTTCQVYGGAWFRPTGGAIGLLEDHRSEAAVGNTSGRIRRLPSGAPARTEFSSSTGGWTAGGQFTAVPDVGDSTAANPHRRWTVQTTLTELTRQLGTAAVTGVRVTGRNGLGADGGRVTSVEVSTSAGRVTMSGSQFRSRTGLKSDWFTVIAVDPAEAGRYVRSLYRDLLGRPADPGGESAWTAQVVGGAPLSDVAFGVAASPERYGLLLDRIYVDALDRHVDPSGVATWVPALAGPATYNEVAAFVYGSAESYQVLAGGDLSRWVDSVYRRVLGRPVDPSGLSTWTAHARRFGLGSTAMLLLTSPEATGRRLDGYYRTLLGRGVDPSGVAAYQPLLAGDGDVEVPVLVAGSAEYWNRAQATP